MKAAYLVFLLFASAALQAQKPPAKLPRLQERVQSFYKRGDTTLFRDLQNTALAPSNKVVSLPQDGTPCIVPDTRYIAKVPNKGAGWKHPEKGRIPNLIQPKKELEK